MRRKLLAEYPGVEIFEPDAEHFGKPLPVAHVLQGAFDGAFRRRPIPCHNYLLEMGRGWFGRHPKHFQYVPGGGGWQAQAVIKLAGA